MADERYTFQEVSREVSVAFIPYHFVKLKTIKTSRKPKIYKYHFPIERISYIKKKKQTQSQ